MEKQHQYGSEDIKTLAWVGPAVETDEGRNIYGVVGKTQSGEYKAGFVTADNERDFYKWQQKAYVEKDHAIFAARKEAQNQQRYDRAEPDRQWSESDAQNRWDKIFKP